MSITEFIHEKSRVKTPLRFHFKKMKRVLILIALTILLTSTLSAEMIITQQPKELYNLGEVIKTPVKIVTSEGVDDFFSMRLICNGIETEINKQYVYLLPGDEQSINAAIPLRTDFIGRTTGTCVIKAFLGSNFILTNEFTISDLILIEYELSKESFNPSERVVIEGTAVKENGENVQGFVNLELIMEGGESIQTSNTVKNGYFFLNLSLPKDAKAGQYLAKLDVYETEGTGNRSNTGLANFNLGVNQVPTSLEILFDKKPAVPGEDLKVKAILHDQTGEKIESEAIITIEDDNDKILEQTEVKTDEYLSYPIEYNQAPGEWTVYAVSNKIEIEESFNISKKETVEVDLINRTVIITNKGNVPYNKTALIKIGNETINLDIYLEVDEETKYYLSAPEGEYEIEIRAGEEKLKQTIALTGNAIRVEEIGHGLLSKIMGPVVWVFIIGVLGFMVYLLHKKGYKKTFVGYVSKAKEKIKEKTGAISEAKDSVSLISPKNPAELSLSIKGEKQDVSLICLKIKNEKQLLRNEVAKDALNKIVHLAEEKKAVTYENQNNIFFIWVPLKTKTFKNAKTAVETAQEIHDALNEYNKLAKDKINFGMSLNYGTVVAKQEKDSLKFMSMGTLITTAKKIAGLSDSEIYLSEKINEKIMTQVKTTKHEKDNTSVWTIKEIRQKNPENKRFISEFIRRLESDKKQKFEKKEEKKSK